MKSGFDSENLMWLEQLFRQTVGNEMEIKRDDFNKILITKNVSTHRSIDYIIHILLPPFKNSEYATEESHHFDIRGTPRA